METNTIKYLLLSVVILVGVSVIAYLIGYRDGLNQATMNATERLETLVIRDTITQYKPIVEERVVLERVPYPVTDTLKIHDTLFVYLQREQVVWQDSLSRVYASGILPQIDSVQHFIQDRIVTIEKSVPVKKPCRWGIGVQAGYGIQIGKEVAISPYIGVGLTYNFISW